MPTPDLRTAQNVVVRRHGAIPGATETVSTSTASALSTTDLAPYTMVRLLATALTFVNFTDSSGTATSADMPLAANIPEVFCIGLDTRIAAILSADTGSLYITVLG